MHTNGPWKVGKKVGDTWCVITTNPINGREERGDDIELYGGTPIARGLTLENARLIAAAPDLFKIVQGVVTSGVSSRLGPNVPDVHHVCDTIFTGCP